jgi:hypothetical protein
MQPGAYAAFRGLTAEFKRKTEDWSALWPRLKAAQQSLARENGHEYRVETPVVYNGALDAVTSSDEVRIVIVADNPGLNEQRADKRAYLVGQSGRLAEGFFSRELGMDFRRCSVILNKTPVHTPKTKELAGLLPAFAPLLEESQRYMASLVFRVASALGADIWVFGYSELGKRGLFGTWSDSFRDLIGESGVESSRVLVFRHFSMNQFSGDYKRNRRPGEAPMETLRRIGAEYRRSKLGME